jgi:hypothetical protein
MTENDPKGEERVEDLDVPESESEDVKGGLLPYSKLDKTNIQQKFNKIDFQQKVNPGNLGSNLGDGSV